MFKDTIFTKAAHRTDSGPIQLQCQSAVPKIIKNCPKFASKSQKVTTNITQKHKKGTKNNKEMKKEPQIQTLQKVQKVVKSAKKQIKFY